MGTKYLIILSLILISFKSYSQLGLPKIETTDEKAFSDLGKGIAKEEWFLRKNKDGILVYSKIFKGTPVGISHAMNEYEQLVKKYNGKDCIDKSLYSNSVKDFKGAINYDMLSHTIRTESSEIVKYCFIKDKVINKVLLSSMITVDSISVMVIYIEINKTE